MPEPAQISVDLVTRNPAGSNPAGDRPQLAVANQRANVFLGAAQLGGKLANRQGCGPLHAESIAGLATGGGRFV